MGSRLLVRARHAPLEHAASLGEGARLLAVGGSEMLFDVQPRQLRPDGIRFLHDLCELDAALAPLRAGRIAAALITALSGGTISSPATSIASLRRARSEGR